MKRILAAFIVGWIGLTIACAGAWAQATAQISGTVRDQSGAVLPGVEVTVTQTETGVMRITVTNETGAYLLQNLAIGPYRLEASLPGFRTFVQTGIVLQVNSNPVINPLSKSARSPTRSKSKRTWPWWKREPPPSAQVIENERILELPLNGRQATDLITLSGASVQTGGRRQYELAGRRVNLHRRRPWLRSFVLSSMEACTAIRMTVRKCRCLSLMLFEEFQVDASGSPASGGRLHSSGAVNAVTKSGTNEFHGDGFYFVRNYLFNARNCICGAARFTEA